MTLLCPPSGQSWGGSRGLRLGALPQAWVLYLLQGLVLSFHSELRNLALRAPCSVPGGPAFSRALVTRDLCDDQTIGKQC